MCELCPEIKSEETLKVTARAGKYFVSIVTVDKELSSIRVGKTHGDGSGNAFIISNRKELAQLLNSLNSAIEQTSWKIGRDLIRDLS